MIRLIIKDLKGKTQEISVNPSDNVSKIKSLITRNEETPPKLIFNGIILNDDLNITTYSLQEGSTIIRLERRKQKEPLIEIAPTLNTIKEATLKFKKEGEGEDQTVSKNIVEDVQKKLENLIQSFFGQQEENENNNQPNNNTNPNNTNPSTSTSSSQQEPEPEIPIPDVDFDSLDNLMSMGFPENACKKALIFTKGNCEEALEWILQHSEDQDFNEPITQRQLKGLGIGQKPNQRRTVNEFVPHPLAFQRLTEMGFDENQVTEALRTTNNDEQAAAAFLLGDGFEGGGGRGGGFMDEFDELEDNEAILQNPLIRALLQNPAVQSGMTNPRVIQAFQRIMENPQSAGEYLRDPLIGPILMQVNSIITTHQPNLNNPNNPPNQNENPQNNNNPNSQNNQPNQNNQTNNNQNNNNPNDLQNNNNPNPNPLQLNTPLDNNNLNLNPQNINNIAVNLMNNFNQLGNLFLDDGGEDEEDEDENEGEEEEEDDMVHDF